MPSGQTNVRFNRGGNILNIPRYYKDYGITERDLLFLNGDTNGISSTEDKYPVTPADTLIMADAVWVDKLREVIGGGRDWQDFLHEEGPAPIVATSRLSLINPDFRLDHNETKLVVATGNPTIVRYNIDGSIVEVGQYENSLDVFNILSGRGTGTYAAASDSNIPTGQAVKDMITTGIGNFVGIMEYKGALTSTSARHNSGDTIQKGWVYIASTDIYGYEQDSVYSYGTSPQTSQGTLVFRCESGDMVVVNQDISANVPLMNTGSGANCDVFERNLTGAVTATSTFGSQNRVILSDGSSRTIKSISNGSNGTVLTIVGGVPTWQTPTASVEVSITQDETTNEYKSIIFSGIAVSGADEPATDAETVYYSSKAGFNPSTGSFASKDISVHRGNSNETAWVSESIFWYVLEPETQV